MDGHFARRGNSGGAITLAKLLFQFVSGLYSIFTFSEWITFTNSIDNYIDVAKELVVPGNNTLVIILIFTNSIFQMHPATSMFN